MTKKRICFIAQFPPPIHGLSKAVETLYDSPLQNEFDFERINITNNYRFPETLIKILISKADLFYFTISQSKGGNLRDLIILRVIQAKHKKCVIHLHGGYYRHLVDRDLPAWQRKANYRAVSRADGAIVLSQSLRPIFEGMVSEEKIFVVPNCVDDACLISDAEFEQKLTALEHKKIWHVLGLSNFMKEKGYPKVLEMAKLEKQRVDAGAEKRFHFDFAGKFFKEADYRDFQNYISENQLQNDITYHGIVSGDAKRKLLKECDIFVLLTRYRNEGQPISILEAMGNGLYILTTDQGGIPDIVKDGENGTVLTPEKEKNLSAVLTNLRPDAEISARNRKYVKEHFSEARYLNDISAIFSGLIYLKNEG